MNIPFGQSVQQAKPLYDDPSKQQIYDYLVSNGIPGGGQAAQKYIDRAVNAFSQTFQNQVGSGPNAQDISGFLSNEVAGQQHPDWQDPYQLAQNYIPNAFGQQIRDNQQSQSQNQIDTLQKSLNNVRQSGMDFYTKGPGLENIKGLLNNSGMLDSGAFPQALATALAGNESQIDQSALSNFILPQFAGNQQSPYQALAGQSGQLGQGISNTNLQGIDFGIQSELAKIMQNDAQPSGFQNTLANINAGSSAAKNIAGVASMGTTVPTSYICLELIKRGLLKDSDLDDLHNHLMPAVFVKGRAFWLYAMKGHLLVEAANQAGIDWSNWKRFFFDIPMAEKNAVTATDLYAYAFGNLCMKVKPEIWDYKVFNTGFLDSVPYFPRLLTHPPYIKALKKVMKRRLFPFHHCPRVRAVS